MYYVQWYCGRNINRIKISYWTLLWFYTTLYQRRIKILGDVCIWCAHVHMVARAIKVGGGSAKVYMMFYTAVLYRLDWNTLTYILTKSLHCHINA